MPRGVPTRTPVPNITGPTIEQEKQHSLVFVELVAQSGSLSVPHQLLGDNYKAGCHTYLHIAMIVV